MTLALTGYGAARGIAIGRCHLAERNELDIGEYRIPADAVEREIERFRNAIDGARRQLEDLADRVKLGEAMPAAEIIETHVLMLGDSKIRESTEEHIRRERCNAEWALQTQLEQVMTEFRNLDDDYIRTRGEDITQVVRLVQDRLNEETAQQPLENIPDRLTDSLVVASELTPGELAILHERGVAGIVTEHGGPNSHTAILASSLGIPAVLAVRRAQSLLQEGEQLVLDGGLGVVYADPDDAIGRHYQQVQRDTRRFRQSLEAVRELPATSLDGSPISLQANAERGEELGQALEHGAAGIGLYRTEFLYLAGAPPDEDSQLAEYRKAIRTVRGIPITIRTLDLGADKSTDSLDFSQLRRSANPALGLRAIRLCLRDTELFKTQLRAVLRASAHGPVRCLIPMLTSLHEIRMVHTLLDEAREELDQRGQAYDRTMPVGGMIEVPAAAMGLRDLGRFLDFISVGTNDLLQYTLAADRADEQVAHLYDLQHPGVMRLLRHIFKESEILGIPVTVCGEVAGNRQYTRLLLALGLREFSMHPGRLLEVKQVIRKTHIPKVREALENWFEGHDGLAERSPLQLLDESQL
ncbi:MAG: phosphoenolpyruvate--protein phosphotransferase [Gammaproteobacteria bacterium]|nr:phosphoenolpyruvate--protein phosphotransferase [Gammaproteobacteria bacterium]